jgi:membrane fusion protein, multidrug efflux system
LTGGGRAVIINYFGAFKESMPRPRLILPGSLVALVVFVSCTGKADSRRGAGAADADARKVQVVPALKKKIARTVVAVGTLAAEEKADLGFKVPGRLKRFTVDLGSRVPTGGVLAELEERDYELRRDRARAALEQARARLGLPIGGDKDEVQPETVSSVRQARARLEQARSELERGRALLAEGILARSAFDVTEANYKVAEGQYTDALQDLNNRLGVLAERRSDLALAEQQLQDTVLRAPFPGGVQQRRANVGEYLEAGARVLTLVQVTPLRLRVDVPEREAPSIHKGQAVTVRLEGDENAWPGTIARISPALEEANRSLIVEAEVDNAKGLLRPGSFARAEIVTDSGDESLVVPASAVVVFAGIEKVLTVKDGKALERPVTTGRRTEGLVELESGVTEGELVVVKPGNLATGMAVVVEADVVRESNGAR